MCIRDRCVCVCVCVRTPITNIHFYWLKTDIWLLYNTDTHRNKKNISVRKEKNSYNKIVKHRHRGLICGCVHTDSFIETILLLFSHLSLFRARKKHHYGLALSGLQVKPTCSFRSSQ